MPVCLKSGAFLDSPAISIPGSLALFHAFRRRFREVVLDVAIPELMMFGIASSISLVPRFKGGPLVEGIKYEQPTLNLREAKLRFAVVFETQTAELGETLRLGLEDALRNGPFKDRAFYMDPVNAKPPKSLEDLDRSRVHIAVEGGDVPGLTIPDGMRTVLNGWQTFIPPGKERLTIDLASTIESLRAAQTLKDIPDLERELANALTELGI